jgi:beta-galactosidase/beta-glucuronidase
VPSSRATAEKLPSSMARTNTRMDRSESILFLHGMNLIRVSHIPVQWRMT